MDDPVPKPYVRVCCLKPLLVPTNAVEVPWEALWEGDLCAPFIEQNFRVNPSALSTSKNKISRYSVSKMGLFGKSRELQFGTGKLWWIIGKSEETKGRPAFIRFQGKLGSVVLSKSSLEKNTSWRFGGFLLAARGRKRVVVEAGRDLPFLKSRRGNSHVKNVLPCTRRKVIFLSP